MYTCTLIGILGPLRERQASAIWAAGPKASPWETSGGAAAAAARGQDV